MKTDMECHTMEERLKKCLKKEIEIREQEKLENVVHDLKIMASQLNSICQWISSQFGVHLLISNESITHTYKCIATTTTTTAAANDELLQDDVQIIDISEEQRATFPSGAGEGAGALELLQQKNSTADDKADDNEKNEDEFILPDTSYITADQQDADSCPNQTQYHLIDGGVDAVDVILKLEQAPPDEVSAFQSVVQDTTSTRSTTQTKSADLLFDVLDVDDTQQPSISITEETSSRHLTNLLQTHTVGERSSFSCSVCHKGTRSAYHLRVHMRTHTDAERPSFYCQVCSTPFRERVALEAHLNWHRGEKPYPCRLCDSRFFSNKSRYRHEISVHKKKKKTTSMNSCCSVCGLRCTTSTELKAHTSQEHMNNEVPRGPRPAAPASCPQIASLGFAAGTIPNIPDAEARNLTTSTSTDNKPSPTPSSSSSSSNAAAAVGKKAAHRSPATCQHCKRTFARRSNLNRHLLLHCFHTGEKPYNACSTSKPKAALTSASFQTNHELELDVHNIGQHYSKGKGDVAEDTEEEEVRFEHAGNNDSEEIEILPH